MHTYWRVDEVTEKPGLVLAKLTPVAWFKTNPEYAAHADEVGWDGEEFIDAYPGDDGAECVEEGGPSITLDVTEGPDLHPLDNVMMAMTVATPVEV